MEKGDIVTISRNKFTGDRSYINDVWQVTGINNSHVGVKSLLRRRSYFLNSILQIDEHDFSANGLEVLAETERRKALIFKEFV